MCPPVESLDTQFAYRGFLDTFILDTCTASVAAAAGAKGALRPRNAGKAENTRVPMCPPVESLDTQFAYRGFFDTFILDTCTASVAAAASISKAFRYFLQG